MKNEYCLVLVLVFLMTCTSVFSQRGSLTDVNGNIINPNDCPSNVKQNYYRDSDGDGYGAGIPSLLCPPGILGYVNNNYDCDDSNSNITIATVWYIDADNDGFGSDVLGLRSCTDPSNGNTNYANNNDDCDDTNNQILGLIIWYADADNDGFGDYFTPTSAPSCNPPSGYVSNSSDCNDNDANIHVYTWYQDYDQDGLGDPSNSIESCNPPNDNYWVLNANDMCPSYTGEPSDNGCPIGNVTEEPWNTIMVTSYDVQESPIAKTKSYFDCLGRQVQNLSLDYKTNTTWASETLYDTQGRAALQTLSAPAYPSETFVHKEGFVLKPNQSVYTANDFEANPNEPEPVGDAPFTLGWYYSNANTNEPYQDITEYPFSRTLFSNLNPSNGLKALGGNKTEGEWKNGYTFTMKAGEELTQTLAFNDPSYSSNNRKILKTVSRNVHGVENVVFTDTDGKTLAAARSGGSSNRTSTVSIGEQGYVDIHVPENASGFGIANPGNIQTEIFDLITEQQISSSTSTLSNGFYRVSIINLSDYDVSSPVVINYSENYYDYSLNLYDDIGRLISSKQPLNHLETTYEYDTLGQLIKTTSPDEGTAEFLYRKDGQIRYSQNSKQSLLDQVSYTNYDNLGRPTESGVINTSIQFLTLDPDSNVLPSGTIQEKVTTFYDAITANELPSLPGLHSEYHNPTFLAGNVTKTNNDQTTTYYSYDAYGRVKWIVQNIVGLGVKTIDYTYDGITGQVNRVTYQRHNPDERFIHRYTYDPTDYSLIKVETCTDDTNFTEHATYEYYETGALKRTELAGGLQGIDYVYNLGGQLKAINHPGLNSSADPGNDDDDFFGMTIDYHSDDYLRSSNFSLLNSGTNQFNGNIKGITWNTNINGQPQASYSYSYNRNNWLTQADFSSVGSNPTDYQVSNITYDANGNIQSLKRNKNTESNSTSNVMDDLIYHYDTINNKPNQLKRVQDNEGDAGVGDIDMQTGNNYEYNAIGQLIKNNGEDIGYKYNTSGLVIEVYKLSTTNPIVKFFYDDKGKRVKKESYNNGNISANTFYIRDASGKPMAIYENNILVEHAIYGSSRLGIHKRQDASNLYQLTDHLGNVRAVMLKPESGSTLALVANTDYYPFGMTMPNRNIEGDYRYAYQGQEKDSETGKEAFELRLWDPRIGRWLTTDPAGQYSSPYLGMGNNPVTRVDPDGGFDEYLENEDGSWSKVSNLGGDELDFYHYTLGKNAGQTAISDGANVNWMSSSRFILGYMQRNFKTGFSDITTEFLKGVGPENSIIYGANHPMNIDMSMSKVAYMARTDFVLNEDENGKVGGYEEFGLSGLKSAGLNMTEQMVGSAAYSVYALGDDKVMIALFDSKSKTSLYYHLPVKNMARREWSESQKKHQLKCLICSADQPETTTYQTYIWIETREALLRNHIRYGALQYFKIF